MTFMLLSLILQTLTLTTLLYHLTYLLPFTAKPLRGKYVYLLSSATPPPWSLAPT